MAKYVIPACTDCGGEGEMKRSSGGLTLRVVCKKCGKATELFCMIGDALTAWKNKQS